MNTTRAASPSRCPSAAAAADFPVAADRAAVDPAAADPAPADPADALLRAGSLLFLLGLLTGFGVPFYANPRMGLASHLEGVLNGMFLLVLGLLGERLRLASRARRRLAMLAIYGTFANWAATLLAAILGAGASMPLAGKGHHAAPAQELLIAVLLATLSIAMLAVAGTLLVALRRGAPATAAAGAARDRAVGARGAAM